jgi:hypothetical protein
MRCSTALSLDRNARAISLTVRPEMTRSASAICCVAVGMAADEQQAQDVVAIVRLVDPLDQRSLGILHVREALLVRERYLSRLAPQGVDRKVAPDQDEPSGGIARGTIRRPALERPQAGVLHGLLCGVEVAEIAHQGRQRGRPRGGERAVDPGEIAHVPPLPGQNMETGLIS